MYRYRIINVTDKELNIKQDFINQMKQLHPCMSGEILYPDCLMPGTVLMLAWNDCSGKMLRTSRIEKITGKIMFGDQFLTITTRNSIYTLEKIKEGNNDVEDLFIS